MRIQNNCYEFHKAVLVLNHVLKAEHFRQDSPLFDIQLIRKIFQMFFPLIRCNTQVKSIAHRFLVHWLCVFEIHEPDIMINKLDEVDEEYLMPSLSILANLIPKLTSDKKERICWFFRILEKCDENDLKYLNLNVWQFVARFGNDELILKFVKLLLKWENMENNIIVLINGREKLINYVLQNASYEFLFHNVKKIVGSYNIINLAVRISDDLFLKDISNNFLFKTLDLVLSKELSFDERTSLIPIVSFIYEMIKTKEERCYYECLVSFSKIGLFDLTKLIPFVKFEEVSSNIHLISMFIISAHLIEHEEIQNIIFSLINFIIQRNNISLKCCLIDKLTIIYTNLLEINKNETYNVLNQLFNPISDNKIFAFYSLKFLNSLNNLNDSNFNFDINEIIHKYLWLNDSCIINELKSLIKKCSINLSFKDFDFFSNSLIITLNVVENIDVNILLELLEFNYLEPNLFHVAIERLIHEKHQCLKKVFYSLFMITDSLGITTFDNEILQQEGWISKRYFDVLFEEFNSTLSLSSFSHIISSLLKYISVFLNANNLTNEISDYLIYVVLKLLKYFPVECLNILKIVKESLIDKSLQTILEYSKDDKVLEFAIDYYGPKKAIELIPNQVISLASKNYQIAQKIAPYVSQPLQPMPTFMAFQNEEKHKEWVQQCKSSIEEKRWIIPKEEIVVEAIQEEPSERKYIFNEIQIQKGIDNIFNGTLISIINFFYFSKKEFPFPLQNIESFILENNDLRLIIGFFYHSINHKYQTQRVNEWSDKFYAIYDKSDFCLYAISLFLFSIQSKIAELPTALFRLIRKILFSFGHYLFSIPFINSLSQCEKGMRQLFIYSIISLDIDSFSDYPLTKIKFTRNENEIFELFQQYFANQKQCTIHEQISLISSFSSTIPHPVQDDLIQYQRYPVIHFSMLSFSYSRISPDPINIPSNFIDLFLEHLSTHKQFPTHLISLLTSIAMNSEQTAFLTQLIHPKSEEAMHFFHFLYPSSRFSDYHCRFVSPDIARAFSFLPPSQSRSFYRSLFSPSAPPISQELIDELLPLLTPVPPALSYALQNADVC